MRKTLILVGQGKLANSIKKGLPDYLNDYQIDDWENIYQYPIENLIIVHIGSGRQLSEAVEFCSKNKVPLIQGSTGMNIERQDYNFTFIDAPNLSVLMLKFMHMIKEYGALFQDYQISITESHQDTKKSLPGTAIEIANALNVNPKEIKSIRNQDEQLNTYSIPKESLSLHAFHEISILDQGTTLHFKTLVEGHDSYVKGLSKIIQSLDGLEDKYYHILDLIEKKLI
ncbi:MAG: hypothetical protein A2Y41_03050 [Spirochaetes bacterium GWB1_36_13]|nr:MAG: hypothetical protein A2Y41_03050 [Spirochaetes bacterium GWB1_36_13]